MRTVATRVIPLLLVGGVLAVLTRSAAGPLTNVDTYFHLRFGHEFLTGWSLREPGSVSSFATADWVPTQWLPQVVMAWAEDRFGLAGVAWLFGLQLCALVVTFYLVGRHWADPLAAALVTFVAICASVPFLSMRPQLISFVLLALTTHAWLRARESGRAPWWLVPLTWVWAMCHGMWPAGIVIGVVAVAVWAAETRPDGRRLLRWAGVPVGSLLVAGLTPVGPALYVGILAVGGRAKYFFEWGPTDFTAPAGVVLLVLVLGTALMGVRRDDRLFTALLVVAAGWALYSIRTMPVATAMLVPLACIAVQRATDRRVPVGKPERAVVWGTAGACLVVLAFAVPHTSEEPLAQPSWLDAELSTLPAGTVVLDEWGWGGYLMWRYPQLDLVMHGYGDTFTVEELERNTDLREVQPGWDTMARQTGAEVAVLTTDSPLAYALELERWEVVHEGADLVLLEAPSTWLRPRDSSRPPTHG